MRLLVPLVLALASVAAAAQLYSWKDADGKVHYSDQPPPGKTPARKLAPAAAPAPAPAPAATPAATPKNGAEKGAPKKPNMAAEDAAAKAKLEKEQQAEAEQRRVNCDRARGNLLAIESGTVRFTLSPKGERVALEGAVLQAELDRTRKAVDSWCN